jgi:hypothetical protein
MLPHCNISLQQLLAPFFLLRIHDIQTKDATRKKRLALKLNWYFHFVH